MNYAHKYVQRIILLKIILNILPTLDRYGKGVRGNNKTLD